MKSQCQSEKNKIEIAKFNKESEIEIKAQSENDILKSISKEWMLAANTARYSYHFSWLGRPIIQYPQDIIAMQEIVYFIKPDLIIETGIAHGGSLIFYASLVEINTLCGGPEQAHVLGIDIDIRAHNREAIEEHPLYKRGRITLLEGSSIASDIVEYVKQFSSRYNKIMIVLDSNHSHDHVKQELEAYAPLVSVGSYCVVFDTVIEHLPSDAFSDRPWGKGNNPMSAVEAWLPEHPEFEIDSMMDAKLLISVAPRGYLRRKA